MGRQSLESVECHLESVDWSKIRPHRHEELMGVGYSKIRRRREESMASGRAVGFRSLRSVVLGSHGRAACLRARAAVKSYGVDSSVELQSP